MSNVELIREININCWQVLGTVGLPQERKHIIFILQIAEEEGSVSMAQVNEQLLGNGRSSIAIRLIEQCVKLNLIEEIARDKYRITNIGSRTLQEKSVYVPVESSWRIWTTDEDLVSQKVLKIEEIIPSHTKKSQSRENDEKVTPLPKILQESRLEILSLPFGEISSCTLDLKEKCIPDKEQDKRGQVIVQANKNVQVLLQFGKNRVCIDTLLTQKNQLIDSLMKNSIYENTWKSDYQFLLSNFDELTDYEKANFIKHLTLDSPIHPSLGSFNQTQFEVQIYPHSQRDVDKWADWLLTKEISDFVLDDSYENLMEKCRAPFPRSTPRFKEISEKTSDFINSDNGQRSKQYWYLSATQDWNL